ncbi:MAG TPA: nuclear transport factor 2 family protein [Elusimicrobiota bacterium]|nr:nuclear transport factor 2 family protein [Elusimicrobiota bacterium]
MRLGPILLCAALVGAGASSSRAEDCLALLEGSLRSGDTRVLKCFAKGATWRDESGLRASKNAVKSGLKALLENHPKLPEKGLRTVPVSTGTLLVGPYWDDDIGRRYGAFSIDSSSGMWTSLRLYQGARPWPETPADGGAGPDATALAKGVEAFNLSFSTGNVAGWLSFWRPDATFVSIIGPFVGPEVRTFFQNQIERYEAPKFTVDRDLTSPGTGGTLIEGAIRARCRSNGNPFALPFVMLIRYKDHKTCYVYEAFTVHDDGCGPFWTFPR